MGDEAGRRVSLALVSPGGRPLGALPPFEADVPWENNVVAVVAGARAAYGIDVTVLRLLWVDSFEDGGPLGYLAEYDGPPLEGLGAPAGLDAEEPLRMPWARPGGPDQTLRWAESVLARHRRPPVGAPVQQRTWNLSAIWRIDTADGPTWLKQVPPFFRHEGAVLRWLERTAPGLGPTVLGAAADRMVLEHVPGEDCYHAPLRLRQDMLADLLRLQARAAARVEELLAIGVPDRRGATLIRRIQATVARWRYTVPPVEAAVLAGLVGGLPERLAALAACRVPDTLVHGDFHAGNVRSDGTRRTIIDWGDAVVGHPALDLAAFLERVEPPDHDVLRRQWADHWRAAVTDCEPERAAALMAPVAALYLATVYDGFLRATEPSEHVYHATDPTRWLRRAATLAADAPPLMGSSRHRSE